MFLYRCQVHVAAVLAMLFAIPARGEAAECRDAPPVMELKPGLTKIITPCSPTHSVTIGNPKIAGVNTMNLGTIAVFGKSVGTTDLFLFDDAGQQISTTTIQVGTEIKIYSGSTIKTWDCVQTCSPSTDETKPPEVGDQAGTTTTEFVIRTTKN
jgi:Flp pilus assembly secretin CpaC